ncbi:hypothetical protein O3G_MSEX013765 [Manduca sexta]|uniref:Cuticle protein n=1 Tax=Manduca sexta TaxID=7130 RepID=A0A921ZSD9_MANSE|nr:hypothetical protein O3G_MSEX013765 [Manduca sexta]KAG6463257.1 hypothetical protein O3G_MSEX013765 [Manduca sexta]
MMFKFSVLLMVCTECIYRVTGASFSRVYVQNGQEVVPLEYVQYGAPAVSIPGPQLAQISAAPVGSLLPVASSHHLINPCGAPCVYPGSAIASVAQAVSPTPNFITYKANVPAVVETSEEPTGYEYSYVVYDDGTGDHKTQHESSDGAVVRGQYSFLQPDGYVREVHYTADDLKDFNAVVKKFLPANVEVKDESKEEHLPHIPCHDVNHGSVKTSGHQENHEDHHYHEPNTKETHHKTQEVASSDESHDEKHNEENHKSVEDTHSPKESNEKPNEALTKASAESSAESESSEKSIETQEIHKEHLNEPHHEHEVDGEHKIHEIFETTEHESMRGPDYQDIIKCIQKSIDSKDQMPTPLAYIVLKNPC